MLTISPDILALMGTWTLTVALFSWWLAGQFRRLEKLIYRTLNTHRNEVSRQLRNVENRLFSCELALFGYGPIVVDQPPVEETDEEGEG